ncbi:MAG TPA: hypothetical protein VGE02_01740 [Gemmatimonadales bacterium]
MRAIPHHSPAAPATGGGAGGDGGSHAVVTIIGSSDRVGNAGRLSHRWSVASVAGDGGGCRSGCAPQGRRTWIVGRRERGADWTWCYLP